LKQQIILVLRGGRVPLITTDKSGNKTAAKSVLAASATLVVSAQHTAFKERLSSLHLYYLVFRFSIAEKKLIKLTSSDG